MPLTLLTGMVFFGVTLGIGWPLAVRLKLDPLETIGASAALSLLGVFLAGWAIYVLALPRFAFGIVPLVTVAALLSSRQSITTILRERDVRTMLIAQGLVTAWCVGCLALVVSYAGGGWVADWYGHWQRVCFFLEHWPQHVPFNNFDPVTSRPPLANVVIGVFLRLSRNDFANYQVVTTLFGSLAFFPAALLARRFGGMRAIPLLTVFFMLNPLFVQNATFAWTKLPAAFFTLTALYFFLRAHDPDQPVSAAVLFAASLAGALLTHYSAGPYAVLFAGMWMASTWTRRRNPAWWRGTMAAAALGGLLLAAWFGWAFATFGLRGALLTNTSVTDAAPSAGAQLTVVALNLRDTLVPHFLRAVDLNFIAQSSRWGWWRDWFFQLYQVNFFFAFGSVAGAVIAFLLVRSRRDAVAVTRAFWPVFITGTVVLGVAVHGARDTWGLAHICLQPLVLLGLAFLASRWNSLGGIGRGLVVGGATLDLALGIALQLGAEGYGMTRWLGSGPGSATSFPFSVFAAMNFRGKLRFGRFFSDTIEFSTAWVMAGLIVLLAVALIRVWFAARSEPADGRALPSPP